LRNCTSKDLRYERCTMHVEGIGVVGEASWLLRGFLNAGHCRKDGDLQLPFHEALDVLESHWLPRFLVAKGF
jgi:hypothetical protein